jgi:hypothetical protein
MDAEIRARELIHTIVFLIPECLIMERRRAGISGNRIRKEI